MNGSRIVFEIKNYITGTREFAELSRAFGELKRNPEAYAPVSEFRKKRESLNRPSIDEETINRIMYELELDYSSLRKHRVIAAYFDAEERLGALVGSLVNELNAAIEAELGA